MAEHPEPFTGERLTAAIGGQVQIEHYHRYLFARAMVRDLDVLDVASGEGYGSALLAQVARSVLGIEYSAATVTSAAANFPRPNLQFMQGDARALPLADTSVDAVVSFETIEHFDRQDVFVREVRRVLRPGGCFIVSTPDREVYSQSDRAANQYHVHELSRAEFVTLLHGCFHHVTLLQQRPMHGSVLLGESATGAQPLVFERRGEMHFEASIGVPRAPYFVAIASDEELPPLSPSVYIDRGDLDTDRRQVATLTAELTREHAERIRATEELATMRARCDDVHAVLAQTQTDSAQCHAELAATSNALGHATISLQEAIDHAVQLDAAARETERRRGELQQQLLQLQLQFQLQMHEQELRFNALQGSCRTFLRGYLPLLYRHIRGRRP